MLSSVQGTVFKKDLDKLQYMYKKLTWISSGL